MIIALYVASLCRSTKTLAITGMALGSLVVVGGYLHHWVLLRLALLTYSATGLWLAKVILCVGLGTLMIRQYVRQNTTVHAFAGVAVLLAVGLVSLAMPNPHRTIPVLFASGESVQVESVTVFPADQSPPAHPFAAQDAYWREQGHPPRIATPMIARVRLDGFDPGHLWRLHSWNFNSSGRGHRYWPPSLVGAGLFPLSTVANQIGLQGYRFQEGENTSMNIVFERLSHDDAPSVPPPARVFHFSVQRLKLRRVGEAPLHVDRSSLHATNTGLEILQIDPDQGWFVARFSNPDFENRRITLGWDRATEPLLVAVNDATQDATIVRPLPPTMAELRARTPDSPQRFTLPNLPGDIRIIAIIGDVTGALYLPSSVAKPSD
ncbi:hypothetical protein [Synoicihabitans lomoniglobus]|nr:hypothetical protein [Opitutaceae bacterium LMO-M01]